MCTRCGTRRIRPFIDVFADASQLQQYLAKNPDGYVQRCSTPSYDVVVAGDAELCGLPVDRLPIAAVDVPVRHQWPASSPTAVYSVRVPVDRRQDLREPAARRGVQPSALIRAWVSAQLDAVRDEDDRARRWEREVREATE